MASSKLKRRVKKNISIADYKSAITIARQYFDSASYVDAFDIYEQILRTFPEAAVELLSELYDKYQILPERNRYNLYQSRIYNFDIKHDEKVLDIGSGHMPFPFATHLADITLNDHSYGRAGAPFKYQDGKPCYEFNIEEIPFEDNEFDLVYCSHVLEHTEFPEKACEELKRIAKRGYIETPTRAKDLWLNSAKISNHIWAVEYINETLTFDEYEESDLLGVETDILMNMHVAPQTERERAYSALIYLKPDMFNTMVYWEDSFKYEVKRKSTAQVQLPSVELAEKKDDQNKKLSFVQVHTFYPHYLNDFYKRNPKSLGLSFNDEKSKLLEDGFSAAHLLGSELQKIGYETETIVANCMNLQYKWIRESNSQVRDDQNAVHDIVIQQLETIKPDILYLTDPMVFDSKFIRKLSFTPKLVIGWRAASIFEGTDWSSFDVMLTSLNGMKDYALQLGAKSSELFYPGFPNWILDHTKNIQPQFDLSFVGQWKLDQYISRNKYLTSIAENSESENLNPAFYLSGQLNTMNSQVLKYDRGSRFGIEMHKAIKSGKIAFDARGDINYFSSNQKIDLTNNETANMRIFEATGEGVFLLTEHHKNLDNLFEIGKEIETFSNEKELMDKIKYYISHDNERNEIALKGQQRCLADHSLEKRIIEFDRIIKSKISNEKSQKVDQQMKLNENRSIDVVKEIIKQAADRLDENKLAEAFQLLIKAKAYKLPVENLDLLRAAYFMQMNQMPAARESVYEELSHFPENQIAKNLLKQLESAVQSNINDQEFNSVLEKVGPYTMLSIERLYSLWQLAKNICEQNLIGNFVECGVARGGSSALLAYVIKHYSKSPRKLYSFDSFEGMPEPTSDDTHGGLAANDTGWGTGTCSAPEASLVQVCEELNVIEIVKPVKGFFQDTLPLSKNEIGSISLLHMDGDWYESTKSILDNLYDQVIHNGAIQVDDFGFWEGCRKAIEEFQLSKNIKFDINVIDNTGVWFTKPEEKKAIETTSKENLSTSTLLKLLNLGCGNRYHENWTNIDFISTNENILAHDLKLGVPFNDNSFHAVYHSHVLEHFPKADAVKFMKECYRVLKPGGVIRIAVPNLEEIVRQYLLNLDKAISGDAEAQSRYDWIMLELFDQAVRNYSGGEMLEYWKQDPMPAEAFVIERLGSEVKGFLQSVRLNGNGVNHNGNFSAEQIGQFRLSGEIHQWMYDRFSLGKLLSQTGFNDARVCEAHESSIPNFNNFLLDIEPDGSIRKPDSLFMEAIK
jgi:predicted SAM-dependent methyltransferase